MLNGLAGKLNVLATKPVKQILLEWGLNKNELPSVYRNIQLYLINLGYKDTEVDTVIRRIDSNIRFFDTLPSDIQQAISADVSNGLPGITGSINTYQVARQLETAVLHRSRHAFLLDEKLQDKLLSLADKAQAAISKVTQDIQINKSLAEDSIKALASFTSKGVSTFSRWFSSHENDQFEANIKVIADNFQKYSSQIRAKQNELTQAVPTLHFLASVFDQKKITDLLMQGKINEANALCIAALVKNGTNIAYTNLYEEIIKVGFSHQDMGLLQRLMLMGELSIETKSKIEAFLNPQVPHQSFKFNLALKTLKHMGSEDFENLLKKRETQKLNLGENLEEALALSAIDNDPHISRLQNSSVELIGLVAQLQALVKAAQKEGNLKSKRFVQESRAIAIQIRNILRPGTRSEPMSLTKVKEIRGELVGLSHISLVFMSLENLPHHHQHKTKNFKQKFRQE